MDVHRIPNEHDWDLLRLKDIHSPTGRANYGENYALQVVQSIIPHISQCRCIRQLLPHLERRAIVAGKACSFMSSQSDSEAVKSLERLLTGSFSERGSEGKVDSMYLALLDCYEETGDVWCWSLAASKLRPSVRLELKLPNVDHYDWSVVVQRVPAVNIQTQHATQLTQHLRLGNYGPLTDLKQIVNLAFRSGVDFLGLVSALLLTPFTGRYLSLLLPYCHCNPPHVYQTLLRLQQNWPALAVHLGYTEVEIDAVARAGEGRLQPQVRMFLRVWWMPDCGDKTPGLLDQVIQERLRITVEPARAEDDGRALLAACMSGDWDKAETLIKSGSHLGARSEDGRTPLMHACLRGKERIVKLLIDHGADTQAMDKRGEACLNYTETLRNRTILERILKEYRRLDASVDVESLDTGCSPLSTACKCGAVASAELLLEYGANPNGSKNGKHRPLVEASSQGHVGLVRALLRRRADVDATGNNGYTALLQACSSNHWGVAQLLMDEGADVDKCAPDCTSPLFLAASANSYHTAAELIKKGANVDAVRFQPGAVEGIVELTPLAHAAGKGFNNIVQLLMDNGANVNYLCSDTLPAIAFSIIGDHIETFHLLFDSPNVVKTLSVLAPTIITSVRTEKYYYTEKLLDYFGGPQVAMMQAQQDRLEQLMENILMYMQAVNHPQLTEVALPQHRAPPPSRQQVRLGPGEQERINSTLIHFSSICVSAVLESTDVQVSPQSLVEIAQATASSTVASFFRKVISGSMTPEEIRLNFLQGEPSPLRFLIENKILTMEVFVIEVLKFHPEDSEVFYKNLVWTFRHMNGGADLPDNIHSMLTRLFNGRFTPRTPTQQGAPSRGILS
jgi:ankyrin repeat protein